MAQSSAVNTDTKLEQSQLTVKNVEENNIKKEVEVKVKPEPHECVVCATRAADTLDIYSTNTVASGTTLYEFMCKFTPVDLANTYNNPKYMCKSCFDLVNVLEQAELEYMKLKHTFEAIISKNPLYEPQARQTLELDTVKAEIFEDVYDGACENLDVDSEDEPLALTKKKRHRKVDKRKKKPTSTINKRKLRNKNGDGSWECNICGMHGATGGELAESAHKLNTHSLEAANPILREVKKENSVEGSQSPHYNNGFDTASDTMFKIEMGDFNDDRGSNFTPDDLSNGDCKKSGILLGRHSEAESASAQKKKRKKRETKVIHQCDQCDAKYTSLSRLEHHKQKHEHSKPPYICEVCGAHYKHKRACDIHVAMHKGISDWKCEECNKLFPSKGALQRHNNIHTGKPNYQCDLCGKSFIHTSSFKMHKLSHSGVKSHACDVCGLALMTRSHLKRHKRVHSGEKRHECAVCGKRFSERYNLVAHSKSHESAADAPQPPQPRRRLFRCNFCQERYERRYMLERHTSLVHGRTLERPPPTPRNTMSKLLKAQAQGRRDQPPPAAAPPAPPHAPQPRPEAAAKGERSPEPRPPPAAAHKLLAHISSASISASAWSGAYAAEFGLRHEFPH